ncbi:MAG: type II toxin-antitoxin system VapB family antitoxin [Myxococcota bacterium]
MALNIKNEEAERLARLVAREADETVTEAIAQALRERLARLRARRVVDHQLDRVLELAQQCARLPDQDPRSPDEILGYDEHGTP